MIGCFALGYFTFIIDPYAKNARVGARLTNHIYAREEAVENSPIWYRFECQFHISNNALLDRTTKWCACRGKPAGTTEIKKCSESA